METKNNKYVKMDMKQYGMFFALIAIYLVFALLTKGANLTPMNINNLIMQNGYVVILAIGMLLCVLTGNIDLGVGSVVAVCGSFAGIIMMDLKMNMWVAIIAALLVGLLTGVFAGFFIAYLGIPPFVTTLATMLMGRGLTYTLLQAQTKGPFDQSYNFIGAGFLPVAKIPFGDGTLDLVSIVVAVIASVLLIYSEIRSNATKKKYNFAVNPTWQIALKRKI